MQRSRNAPTRVNSPNRSKIAPSNSEIAAAPNHNQAGFINGKGVLAVGPVVNDRNPGPPKVPSTFPAPCAKKTAAITSLSGNGVHDEDVETILLNIGRKPFRRRT